MRTASPFAAGSARRSDPKKTPGRQEAARSHQSVAGRFRRTPSPSNLRRESYHNQMPLRFALAIPVLCSRCELRFVVMMDNRVRVKRRKVMPATIGPFRAFIFDDPSPRPLVTVQHQSNSPGPRIDLGVFQTSLVAHRIGAEQGVTLDDMQLVAVKVSGLIKPGLVAEVGDVYNEGIFLPVAAGIPHEEINPVIMRSRRRLDDAVGMIVRVDDRKIPRALNELKRRRKIGGSRHASLEAIGGRICGGAILEVCVALLQGIL